MNCSFTTARLLSKLKNPEAEDAWRALIEKNPDCHDYYRGLFELKGVSLGKYALEFL